MPTLFFCVLLVLGRRRSGGVESKLLRLKAGSRVIMLTKELSSPRFEKVHRELVNMGWGQCTARIYKLKT